jgi:hypothetical protein
MNLSNEKKGFVPIILIIAVLFVLVAGGASYYIVTVPDEDVSEQIVEQIEQEDIDNTREVDSMEKTEKIKSNEKDPVVEIVDDDQIQTITNTINQWNWENLGCGSSAPCAYKVCPNSGSGNCYSCTGKYDFTSTQGEKLPDVNTDPLTTTDFTCNSYILP